MSDNHEFEKCSLFKVQQKIQSLRLYPSIIVPYNNFYSAALIPSVTGCNHIAIFRFSTFSTTHTFFIAL